jgi:DNA mismatch repair protein MutL
MLIQVLPDEVASQIAAGEVVERPASVVKELLENALDAQAGQVTVRIESAGRTLIEVSDDGLGIAVEQLALALARHATSKLRSAEDLFHIQTLGFRGEALASIASVSRMTLTSRARDAELGARLVVEGGRMGGLEHLGIPAGTVVRVEDLFYNVPARLKFLKQDSTERQQIDALVTRYALAYPQVRMALYQDARTVLQTTGSGNRREVLAQLYGVEIARQMLEVVFEEEGLRVEGFTSPVALTRSNRREITFFVNGRWVTDVPLTTALLQAYHTLLMVGRFPIAVLFITLPPDMIDVNVHPAKAEVRFRQADRVFSGVQRAVKRALLAYSPVPSVAPQAWQPAIQPKIGLDWALASGWDGQAQATAGEAQGADGQPEAAAGPPSESPLQEAHGMLPSGALPLLRLVGQVGSTYLVAEGPDGLYLIDQHAAHERVLFERFRHMQPGSIPSQSLLEPLTVTLPPDSAGRLQQELPILERLGFGVEPFGPSTFRVRAIPAMLVGMDPTAALRVVVEDFEEDETPLKAEIEARLVARICKRAAVKAGQTMSPEEQRALLRDLESCVSPRTCPHGRPTMIHLPVDLLERQFGRRGAR